MSQFHTLYSGRHNGVLRGYSAVCLPVNAADSDRDFRADSDTVRRYTGRSALSMADRVLCLTADRNMIPRSILQRVPLFYTGTGEAVRIAGKLISRTE